MNKRTALFIGGPLDREQIVVGDMQFYQCVERMPMPLFPPGIVKEIEVNRITYIPRLVCGTELWAPDTMQTPQIIQLLIQRYFIKVPDNGQSIEKRQTY